MRSFRLLYAIWLLGVLAYFVPGPTWNPVSRMSLTRSVLERGTLSIDATVDSSGDRARAGGHWYTDKAPAPSFLALPAYALAHGVSALRGTQIRYRAVSRDGLPAVRVHVNRDFRQALYLCSLGTAGLLVVWMTLQLFDALRRRYSVGAALFGSLSALIATPMLPYSTSFYGHAIAAALLTMGLLAAGGLRADAASGSPSRAAIAWAGACWALAAGSEYITAVPVVVLSLWLLLSVEATQRLRTAGSLMAGAALPVSLVSLYHTLCFGAPWKTGYSFITRPEFAAGHAQGFMGIQLPSPAALHGMFLSTSRGLFYISPLCLVALALLLAAAWRREPLARLAVLLFAVLSLLNAGYYMWWGGAAAGPRHLVPVLPLLALGLAWAWDRLAAMRIALVALALLSAGNMFAITLVGLEAPEFVDVLRAYAWPRVLSPDVATAYSNSNLGMLAGLSRGASVAPLLIWLGLGVRALLLHLWPQSPQAIAESVAAAGAT